MFSASVSSHTISPPQRRPSTLNEHHHNSHNHHHTQRDRQGSVRQEQYSPTSTAHSTQGHSTPSHQKGTDHSDNSSQEPVLTPHGNGENNMEFKIFRTIDNEEYTVYVRDDGNIFYVDWEQQVGMAYSIICEYRMIEGMCTDSCL